MQLPLMRRKEAKDAKSKMKLADSMQQNQAEMEV
jgi:hypothetical protein